MSHSFSESSHKRALCPTAITTDSHGSKSKNITLKNFSFELITYTAFSHYFLLLHVYNAYHHFIKTQTKMKDLKQPTYSPTVKCTIPSLKPGSYQNKQCSLSIKPNHLPFTRT